MPAFISWHGLKMWVSSLTPGRLLECFLSNFSSCHPDLKTGPLSCLPPPPAPALLWSPGPWKPPEFWKLTVLLPVIPSWWMASQPGQALCAVPYCLFLLLCSLSALSLWLAAVSPQWSLGQKVFPSASQPVLQQCSVQLHQLLGSVCLSKARLKTLRLLLPNHPTSSCRVFVLFETFMKALIQALSAFLSAST